MDAHGHSASLDRAGGPEVLCRLNTRTCVKQVVGLTTSLTNQRVRSKYTIKAPATSLADTARSQVSVARVSQGVMKSPASGAFQMGHHCGHPVTWPGCPGLEMETGVPGAPGP